MSKSAITKTGLQTLTETWETFILNKKTMGIQKNMPLKGLEVNQGIGDKAQQLLPCYGNLANVLSVEAIELFLKTGKQKSQEEKLENSSLKQ